MKKIVSILLAVLFVQAIGYSQQSALQSITEVPVVNTEPLGLDERINEGFTPIADVWGGIVLAGPKYGKKENIGITAVIDTTGDIQALIDYAASSGFALGQRALGSDKISITIPTRADVKGAQAALASLSVISNTKEQKATLPIVVVLLVVGAGFFTLYFGFINIRKFPLSINVVRGKYDELDHHSADPNAQVNIVDG
ncbi:MAG: hypothetical protein ACI959_001184, partial [Limisphaerales bacterium]